MIKYISCFAFFLISLNLSSQTVMLTTNADSLCMGDSVLLTAAVDGAVIDSIVWISDDPLSDPDSLITFAFPQQDTSTYIVQVFTGADTLFDTVGIYTGTITIGDGADTIFTCLEDGSVSANATIELNSSEDITDIIWTPADSFNFVDNNQITVDLVFTTTYAYTATMGNCIITDSVTVRVDSLPDNIDSIFRVPIKEFYCIDEIVALLSNEYDTLLYPDIMHMWSGPDIRTPMDNQNIGLNTTSPVQDGVNDTTIYNRMTTNNACMANAVDTLIVIDPLIPMTPMDTTVCPDQPVDIMITDERDLVDLMWEPAEGLSCDDCLDPTARVSQTTTFMAMAKVEGCDVMGMMTINIPEPQSVNIPGHTVCPGVSTPINVVISGVTDLDPSTFEWINNDQGLDCGSCLDPNVEIQNATVFQFRGETSDGCIIIGSMTVNVFGSSAGLVCEPEFGTDPIPTGTVITVSVNSTEIPDGAQITWTAYGESTTTGNSFDVTARRDPQSTVITAQYTDVNGCVIDLQKTITTSSPLPPEVPTAFAPESGQNNRFRVLNVNPGIRVGKVLVFNRWGQKMFDGTGAEAEWDGTIGGKIAPSDVYVYLVEIDFGDGNFEELRGDLLLVR